MTLGSLIRGGILSHQRRDLLFGGIAAPSSRNEKQQSQLEKTPRAAHHVFHPSSNAALLCTPAHNALPGSDPATRRQGRGSIRHQVERRQGKPAAEIAGRKPALLLGGRHYSRLGRCALSPNGPIAPSRTVSSSAAVWAMCGPCLVPAGAVQNVPASQSRPPVSTIPDSTSTNSSAGWTWTGIVVPAANRTR